MKKVTLLAISVLLSATLISCGSKQAEEETTTPEAPVVETTETTEETTEPEVEEAPAVVDSDAIIAQIDDARKLAVDAGAESIAPELLKEIDDYYASLKANGEDISAYSAELILRYKTLASYAKAKDLKNQIDEHDLASLAQNEYDEGSTALQVVEDAYASAQPLTDEVAANADKAAADFGIVYFAGFKKLAKDERAAAYEAKKLADSVKAGVSRKDEYKAATETFQKGDTLYAMQNPAKAYENYKSSKESYTYLYNDVSEKRAAAQAAIEAAKKRVEASADFAEEADEKAPITEPVEGIEEEDAVLLEADDYENPDDAEIDVSEDLTVEDQVNIVTDEVLDTLEQSGVNLDNLSAVKGE